LGVTILVRKGREDAVLSVTGDNRGVSDCVDVVVVSGCIFDVVKGELVFTGGCDGCASVGTGLLGALITVTVGVFFTTVHLDAGHVEALHDRFYQDRLNIQLGANSTIISSVVCMGYLVG